MSISATESPIERFDPRRGLGVQRGARRHRHLRPLPASVRRRPRSQDVDVHRGGVIPQVYRVRQYLGLKVWSKARYFEIHKLSRLLPIQIFWISKSDTGPN